MTSCVHVPSNVNFLTTHLQTQVCQHTHTYTHTNEQNRQMEGAIYQIWSHPVKADTSSYTTSRKSGPVINKPQRLACYSQEHSSLGVGTQSPTCAFTDYSTARDLVHPRTKPGPQFTVLCGPAGWGANWRRFFLQW